jgi:hypothetical protein
MGGQPASRPADVIVYVDHSDIHEGAVDELRVRVKRLVDFIEANATRLLAYGFHIDEDAARMTVTAVHPDSASLEWHLEIGREEFRKLAPLITLREIEVYGSVSDAARLMLERKAQMLGGTVTVTERSSGFGRIPIPGGRDGGPRRTG